MGTDPRTPAEFDAAYGLTRGTVRGWMRSGVIDDPPTEHAVVAAVCFRPAANATASRREQDERRDELTAAHRAAVHASLAAAPEVVCPVSSTEYAAPAATAGAA